MNERNDLLFFFFGVFSFFLDLLAWTDIWTHRISISDGVGLSCCNYTRIYITVTIVIMLPSVGM